MKGGVAVEEGVVLEGTGDPVVFAWPDFEPANLFAGLAVSRLAAVEALAEGGTPTVMAWAGPSGDEGEGRLRQWVEARRGQPIHFVSVPRACRLNHPWRVRWERAFDFHEWLRGYVRDAPVAAVDFPESGGVAYYSLLAKSGGLDFGGVRFVVEVSGPLRRVRASGFRAIDNLADLYGDYLERRAIELADAMIVPDASVGAWLEGHGWKVPDRVAVIGPAIGEPHPVPAADHISQLVFVAPLGEEGRLPACCRALGSGRMQKALQDKRVVFWGPEGHVRERSGSAFLGRCTGGWKFRWRVESDLSARAAETLFGDGGGVAIFPAGRSVAWLPHQWCRDAGVRCVEPGGAGEESRHRQMDAADLRMTEAFTDPAAMERVLDRVLGGMTEPPAAFPLRPAERTSGRVRLLRERAGVPRASVAGRDTPAVSVCIVTRNRSKLLSQALASIEVQDYPDIEVVLVDDGSTFQASLAFLEEIGPRFLEKGWKLLRQERAFHAAARNRAVREARGDWVLLFDDDCVAEPDLVRRLVTFAVTIGADVVTCPRHVFVGDHSPSRGDRSGQLWVPLGAVPSAGLFENCVGDTNLLARREAFLRVGGLRTDFGVPAADREFLVRAASEGLRVEVMPEVLYHYRVTPDSVSRGLTPEAESLRDLRFARPFVEALPRAMADLPCIAAGWMQSFQSAEREIARLRARIAKLDEKLAGRSRMVHRHREIRVRLDLGSLLEWFRRLGRSIQKRLPGRRRGRG